MASAKRKQDERNLKLLRELVSQAGNKQCFDCGQRGPTYVNMTIGSFVCTSCSGILRGLTPPHRVKSISMATFTQEEIEHVKDRGNDYCRRIWLGLADRTAQVSDTKDEQKMKDLMIAKYEMKRYYLDPSIANQSPSSDSRNKIKTSNGSTIGHLPRVPASGITPTVKSPETPVTNNPNANSFNADFVADFNKVPDPFSAATPNRRFDQTAFVPQPSFANFDDNPVFNAAKRNDGFFNSNQLNESFANFNGINKTPSEDRYAALKDLDSLMKQAQLKEEPTPVTETNNFSGNQSLWCANNQSSNVISNPFTSAGAWQPSSNLINNNSQTTDNTCNPANPFRPTQYISSNDQWYGISSAGNGDLNTSSQSATPFTNRAWQPSVTSYHANPFAVGSGPVAVSRNSNNPFL